MGGGQTGDKPEISEPKHHVRTLQDGKHERPSKHDKTGGFHDEIRPEGRLFQRSDSSSGPKVSKVSLERKTLSVSSHGVWPSPSSKVIYKTPKTGNIITEKNGDQDYDLPGRSDFTERRSKQIETRYENGSVHSGKSRFSNQLGQNDTRSVSNYGVPRFDSEHIGHDLISTQGKNENYSSGNKANAKTETGNSEEFGKVDREVDSLNSSCAISTATLQAFTNGECNSTNERPKLRSPGDFDEKMQGGSDLVGSIFEIQQRTDLSQTLSGNTYHNGRQQLWLGGLDHKPENRGIVESDRTKMAYQRKGIKSGNYGNESFCKRPEKPTHTVTHGQCYSSFPNQQNVQYNLQTTFCTDRQILVSAVYIPGSMNQKADALSRDWTDSSNWRLEKSVFNQIETKLGLAEVDLFADRLNAQKRKYVSWKPDPYAFQTDSFQMSWAKMKGYAFPPFCLIGRVLKKVRAEKANLILITPTWPTQTWYPMLLGMITDYPILLPPLGNLLTSPTGEIRLLIAQNALTMAAWKVSGDELLNEEFLSKLPTYSQTNGEKVQ